MTQSKIPTGETVVLPTGYGYWDLSQHPWGGCFRRATQELTCIVDRVLTRYRNGAIATAVVIHPITGKLIGVSL
jgi:hypothetical protein